MQWSLSVEKDGEVPPFDTPPVFELSNSVTTGAVRQPGTVTGTPADRLLVSSLSSICEFESVSRMNQ